MVIAMRRNGVSGGAGIGRRASEGPRELLPVGGTRCAERFAASLLERPVPGVVELGGEELGIEGGIARGGRPRDRADRDKQVLGLVEEARTVLDRRLGEVDREVAVSEILDERHAEVRGVRVKRGHAHAGGMEGRADRGPVRLRGRGRLRIENEKSRRAAGGLLPEVTARADVSGEGHGRRSTGEAETLTSASETPGRLELRKVRHPFFAGAGVAVGAALSSTMSTFTSF